MQSTWWLSCLPLESRLQSASLLLLFFSNMRRSQSEDLLCAYESSGQKGKASVGSCALTHMRCGVTQEKIALQGKRWRERLRTSRFLTLKNKISLTCQKFRGQQSPAELPEEQSWPLLKRSLQLHSKSTSQGLGNYHPRWIGSFYFHVIFSKAQK